MNVDEAIEKDLKLNVKKTISSPIFWKKIEHFYYLMSSVAKWIERIEGDSSQLSVVPIIFSELKKSFENTLKSNSILKSNEKHISIKMSTVQKEINLNERASWCLTGV